MYGHTTQNLTIRELVEIHRRFTRSGVAFEQVVGTLFVAGVLEKRLKELNDRQIGQLLSDVVGDQLCVFGPEMMICQQAAMRLFRSSVRQLATREAESLKRQTTCSKCGSEMLLKYGIDESDYQECILATCRHRIPA